MTFEEIWEPIRFVYCRENFAQKSDLMMKRNSLLLNQAKLFLVYVSLVIEGMKNIFSIEELFRQMHKIYKILE